MPAALLVLALSGVALAAPAPGLSPGARLYLAGLRADGTVLQGQREQGGNVQGADAACASCHRRSGLGTFEGAVRVPPVAWRLLSRPAAAIAADRGLPHVLGFHPQRGAYTRATLARALREGIDADGRALSWVMPRYPGLTDQDVEHLADHLATLAADPPAGSGSGELRFALVVTPGADARSLGAVQALFERAFADHNRQVGEARPGAGGAATGAYDIVRNLHLEVWPLSGAAADWPAQLDRRQRAGRPFALLGGAGAGDWSVIDDWCEQHAMPLILPGVEAPGGSDGFWAVHLHRGVRLEAQLVADDLRAQHAAPVPLLQVWREGDSGAVGAAALRAALGPDWPVRDLVLPAAADSAGAAADARAAAAGAAAAGASQVLVAWLRQDELDVLAGLPAVPRVYLSGVLCDGVPPRLPPDRIDAVLLAWPWELPARSRVAMNFPLGWLHAKGQPVVDLRAQADAWLASQVLEEALADMVDAYYPDYLVERVESLLGHRLANAHYPRLSLAPGQRFASKGGYLVRPQRDGSLIPEGGWRIP